MRKISGLTWIWMMCGLGWAAEPVVLPAVAVARMGGDAVENAFSNGTGALGVGTIGWNGNIHFKTLVAVDLLMVLEDLPRMTHAELTLQLDFNRFPEHSPAHRVTLIGVTATPTLPNWVFREYFTGAGEEIGRIPGTLKPGERKSFRIEDLLHTLELSPVNRFVWFRIEEEVPGAGNINTVAGYSVDLENHFLTIQLRD